MGNNMVTFHPHNAMYGDFPGSVIAFFIIFILSPLCVLDIQMQASFPSWTGNNCKLVVVCIRSILAPKPLCISVSNV